MQGEETISTSELPRIAEAIFASGVPEVYEAYSAFGAEIVSFRNAHELLAYIQARTEKEKHLGFAVYYPETQGCLKKEKIDLDPKKCNGHTFRYRVSGWGVIQFQLEYGKKTPDIKCRFAVNSELRANKWFDTYPELQSPSLWRWELVEKHTRRLIRELKKCAQQNAPATRQTAARP